MVTVAAGAARRASRFCRSVSGRRCSGGGSRCLLCSAQRSVQSAHSTRDAARGTPSCCTSASVINPHPAAHTPSSATAQAAHSHGPDCTADHPSSQDKELIRGQPTVSNSGPLTSQRQHGCRKPSQHAAKSAPEGAERGMASSFWGASTWLPGSCEVPHSFGGLAPHHCGAAAVLRSAAKRRPPPPGLVPICPPLSAPRPTTCLLHAHGQWIPSTLAPPGT